MNEVWKKPPVSLEPTRAWSATKSACRHGIWWIRPGSMSMPMLSRTISSSTSIPNAPKRETAFGTTVAHGFLTMSLMSIMSYEVMPVIEGTTMGVNYGFDKLRFISPVRAGSRVRGRFTLAEAKLRKPKELQSRTNVTVEIEGEESRRWWPTGSA